jgi:16S rRNA (guanine527-N7)-methyltransferase
MTWAEARVVLLDAGARRSEFLRWAVRTCGLESRVVVDCGRAEEIGRRPDRRERFAAVTARSFGPPAVTAECAASFLCLGGLLVVSSPPWASGPPADRWPTDQLSRLGLGRGVAVRNGFGYTVMSKESETPDRFPRRVGVPAKRPLF